MLLNFFGSHSATSPKSLVSSLAFVRFRHFAVLSVGGCAVSVCSAASPCVVCVPLCAVPMLRFPLRRCRPRMFCRFIRNCRSFRHVADRSPHCPYSPLDRQCRGLSLITADTFPLSCGLTFSHRLVNLVCLCPFNGRPLISFSISWAVPDVVCPSNILPGFPSVCVH